MRQNMANSGIDRGGEQMRRLINTMGDLNKRIEQASETISLLEQESQEISSVLGVIHGSPSRPICWRSMRKLKQPGL